MPRRFLSRGSGSRNTSTSKSSLHLIANGDHLKSTTKMAGDHCGSHRHSLAQCCVQHSYQLAPRRWSAFSSRGSDPMLSSSGITRMSTT